MQNVWIAVVLGVAVPTVAEAQPDSNAGLNVYRQNCASCHEGGTGRMVSADSLRERSADEIYAALNTGLMKRQALPLSDTERQAVATYLSGGEISGPPIQQIPQSAYCSTDSPVADPLSGPRWNGWGGDLANTRMQTADMAALTVEDVPRLRLKWAFGFPGVIRAGSQATVVGGRVLVGSLVGLVYAIDAKIGCIRWVYEAEAGVRTAISVGPGQNGTVQAYFGDTSANVYGVDFTTGELRWKTKVDEHLDARITGAPALHDGRLYVPVASLEEGTAVIATYECCTFRGSVVALDAMTGEQIWKRFAIAEEPMPTERNAAGAQMWGPSGAGIWSAPTLDPSRNRLYVATGDSYSNPAAPESDALMALDMMTGEVLWISQTTPGDAWNIGCMTEVESATANCPENAGPDHDYGSSTIMTGVSSAGQPVLLAGQKSGVMYGLNAHTGEILWETRVADGGVLGGIEWGFASDGEVTYAASSDAFEKPSGEAGGLTAVNITNGDVVWHAPPVQDTCGGRDGCHTGQPAAVTVMPGAVFAGSLDGHLRAHDTATGRVIWDVDTVGEYDTVNGVPARGGALNGPGPTIVDGMLYVTSGYSGRWMEGNVLLAFSVDGM